jgi:osmotically-inducible protein OsmY
MKKTVLLAMCLLLQACTNVAMTGAQAVYNHHSLQKNFSDQYTTLQAYQEFNKHGDLFKGTNITVSTFNGEVLLAGQVPTMRQRFRAEQIVKSLPNVDEVHDVLAISNPTSTLTRVSDIWITTKVKTKLLASDDVDATQVKVVTENGTVYLMGILKPSEAQAAVDVAIDTDGVNSVVKIFKYMRISRS